MKKMKKLKEVLICAAAKEVEKGLDCVDTKELGEVVDMVKDLSEAIYYCSVTEAMEERKVAYEDIEQDMNKHYYNTEHLMNKAQESHHTEHDPKEGVSPASRKAYMEAQEAHKDKTTQVAALNKYVAELEKDILEMMQNASAEEKVFLQQKITTMSSKIK